MFDISFMELLVISIVALIVIGPERLPAVARTLGHLYGRCRNFVYAIRTDIHNEMRMEELKKMQSSVQETVHSIEDSVQQGVDHLKTTIADGKTEETPPTDSHSQPIEQTQTIAESSETAQNSHDQGKK
ncbi:MAG: twin-arginine translocase subunit TatB [Gammaproteobacteria bacterium]|nr:twin-arginine translocase subunit TatB [Pseudomonadota bacterium]QOJ23896.1 MAG: twin-arginine translocase subunit TatB [Gammaproteobacteria bacterium]